MEAKKIVVIGGSAAGPKAARHGELMNLQILLLFKKMQTYQWPHVVILIM